MDGRKESGLLDIIERYEFKYLVLERLIPPIHAATLAVSRPDRYAGPDGTYRISSLYFDTSRFDLFWANDREQKDRFKVRARTYPGKNSPTFLEVKRRYQDVIVKSRGAVPARDWQDIGRHDRGEVLAQLSPGARKATDRFLSVVHRHHLNPVMLVDYEREAYESTLDTYARLTSDRKIVGQRKETLELEPNPTLWRPVDHRVQAQTNENVCVLELKFERRPPPWMAALVRRHELVRYSFSKYCYSVTSQLTLPETRSVRFEGGPLR